MALTPQIRTASKFEECSLMKHRTKEPTWEDGTKFFETSDKAKISLAYLSLEKNSIKSSFLPGHSQQSQ